MSDVPFFRIGMGHRFFNGTLPDLLAELRRLNTLIEKVVRASAASARTAPPTRRWGRRWARGASR